MLKPKSIQVNTKLKSERERQRKRTVKTLQGRFEVSTLKAVPIFGVNVKNKSIILLGIKRL